MRFPRLSYLFHRRVKSDGALAGIPPAPMAVLVPRPASANGLDELVLAMAQGSDTFDPFISAVPVSTTHPLSPPACITPATPLMPVAQTRSLSALSELKKRIRELETALEHQYKANRRVPALERALQSANQTNEQANADLAALRGHLIQTQRSLHAALTYPGADDRARVLAAENAALTAERLRLRRFIELMVAAGAHKPVLAQAYAAVVDGAEPEAALVAAIRTAVTQPDSVWTALLEPVIGPRAPAEYAAQVRCTLNARKEAKEWRKRAKFWRGRAREGGLGPETVTPSPSDISSIVEELSDSRRQAMENLMERRGGRTATLEDIPGDSCEPAVAAQSLSVAITHPSLRSALATFASSLVSDAAGDLATTSSSAVICASQSGSTVRLPSSVSGAYSSLAPLASEVFRASHSVQSRRSSVSFSLSTSISRYTSGFGRASLSASSSGSSEASTVSARSKRRRVELVAVVQPQVPTQSERSSVEQHIPEGTSSTLSSLARLACAGEDTVPALASLPTASSSSSAMTHPSVPVSSSRYRSLSPTPHTPTNTGRMLVPDSDLAENSDEELVIVMHSDAVCTVPQLRPRARAATNPGNNGISPSVRSPEKSRLPVLKKAIRRLSISRPVLMDTTNAATFTFSTASVRTRGVQNKEKENANNLETRECARTSPPRPTKIPMGRRIQQMPADLMDTARRAVQTKGRMRNGTA